jgi:hypothetical protein
LLRCQLGGAKYEKDIDCRRDGIGSGGRRSKDLRFALCSRRAGRHFFWNYALLQWSKLRRLPGRRGIYWPRLEQNRSLIFSLSLLASIYFSGAPLCGMRSAQHVLIKYLYSAASPLTSPKDASAAFFAVTFSTQQVIGYTHTHTRCIYQIPFGRGAILKETLPAPAEGVRY